MYNDVWAYSMLGTNWIWVAGNKLVQGVSYPGNAPPPVSAPAAIYINDQLIMFGGVNSSMHAHCISSYPPDSRCSPIYIKSF